MTAKPKRDWHGMSGTAEHKAWQNIKNRCLNANTPYFCNYGGRGIKMHKPWVDSFKTFLQDVGMRPTDQHTLERIDNDGDYEPANVRWATRRDQARNMRKNVRLTHNGRTQCLAAWADEIGLAPSALWYRVFKAKWPIADAVTRAAYR